MRAATERETKEFLKKYGAGFQADLACFSSALFAVCQVFSIDRSPPYIYSVLTDVGAHAYLAYGNLIYNGGVTEKNGASPDLDLSDIYSFRGWDETAQTIQAALTDIRKGAKTDFVKAIERSKLEKSGFVQYFQI